ncbi:MAG: flagellar hook capping protein [Candidatus Glassbacteria bacterium]|nr:flagellar hook capping protein [Candidatus Glassbacteria bacterium]
MQVDTSNNSSPAWASQQTGAGEIENRSMMLQDDFLKLLVAQLQNQDPLNPASNQEFAAQLAQFSSLEQLTQMNQNLKANLSSDAVLAQSLNNSTATGFIGHEVHATGNMLSMKQGDPASLRFFQDSASTETVIDIYNDQGSLVRTIELGSIQAGGTVTEWDGKDFDGNQLSSGTYFFDVSAVDFDGNRVATTTFMFGRVTGVRYVDNQATLLIGEQEVPLRNVMEIVEPGSASAVPDGDG